MKMGLNEKTVEQGALDSLRELGATALRLIREYSLKPRDEP